MSYVAVTASPLGSPGSKTTEEAGPEETTRFTAEPVGTPVPAVGVWLITLPEGTVELLAVVTAPTVRPAPVIALDAADFVRPTTFGTLTGAGPVDTSKLTGVPCNTLVPEPGL